MSKVPLLQIQNVSKIIRLIIVIVALIHIGSFLFTVLNVEERSLSHQIELKQEQTSYTATVEMTGTGEELAENLNNEGFNGLAILGSADMVIYSIIYFFIYRLFSLYQQGKIFTPANINCIEKIGRCLLAWVLVSLLYPVLVVLIIRFSALSDSLPIMVSVTSDDLIHLLSGLVIYVIAWVMAEAMKLQQEQTLVI